MMKTKNEKIVEWLISKGCKEIKSKSKYRQFTRPQDIEYYFVGRNGALRAGKTASDSVSISHLVKLEGKQ